MFDFKLISGQFKLKCIHIHNIFCGKPLLLRKIYCTFQEMTHVIFFRVKKSVILLSQFMLIS